jgi:hypothetical protein
MSVDLITKFWMAGIIVFGASFYLIAFYLTQKSLAETTTD